MLLNTEKNTNSAINHLVRFHSYDRKGTKISLPMSKKRKQGSLESWNQQAIAHNTVFDNDGWKATFCRWVVTSGVSLRQAASPEHNDLLCFQNPRIRDLVPRSHHTSSAWIMAEYEGHQYKVIRAIAIAKSKLTISFDG